MVVRRLMIVLLVIFGVRGGAVSKTLCSGRVTGPEGRALAVAHVTLLTADRITVVQTLQASPDGRFAITIPQNGLWVLRATGVDAAASDVALYVPDSAAINVSIALGSNHYLSGDLSLSVLGNFNLWSIPKAVPLTKTPEGVFEADIPATTDSIILRVRGFRDTEGGDGVRNATFILNKDWGYDARVPASGGTAHVAVDPGSLDHSDRPPTLTFAKASPRTQRIAAAMLQWWHGEEEYFAAQMAQSLERELPGGHAPDWNAFTAGLIRGADTEKDSLVRSFWDLAYVCTWLKSVRKDHDRLLRVLGRLSPTAVAWSYSPNTLSYAVRNVQWKPAVFERYAKTAMEKHPDPRVRLRVLFNEFVIAFNAERDIRAEKFYLLLTGKYADTPEGRQTKNEYPRPLDKEPKR